MSDDLFLAKVSRKGLAPDFRVTVALGLILPHVIRRAVIAHCNVEDPRHLSAI